MTVTRSVGKARTQSLRDTFHLYFRYPCHHGAITGLRVTSDDLLLFSTGEDGSIFVFSLAAAEPPGGGGAGGIGAKSATNATATAGGGIGGGGGGENRMISLGRPPPGITPPALVHAAEVVQVSLEELEERSHEVVEMRKRLDDMKAENEYLSAPRVF